MEHFKPCPMSTVGVQDRERRVSTVPQYIIGCAAMVITALSALALVLAIAALVVGAIGLHGNRSFSDYHIQTLNFTETYVTHTLLLLLLLLLCFSVQKETDRWT